MKALKTFFRPLQPTIGARHSGMVSYKEYKPYKDVAIKFEKRLEMKASKGVKFKDLQALILISIMKE